MTKNSGGIATVTHKMVPTPIIFLTASKQPGFKEKAKKLGAAGYFEKPYEAEELFGAIRQALA